LQSTLGVADQGTEAMTEAMSGLQTQAVNMDTVLQSLNAGLLELGTLMATQDFTPIIALTNDFVVLKDSIDDANSSANNFLNTLKMLLEKTSELQSAQASAMASQAGVSGGEVNNVTNVNIQSQGSIISENELVDTVNQINNVRNRGF